MSSVHSASDSTYFTILMLLCCYLCYEKIWAVVRVGGDAAPADRRCDACGGRGESCGATRTTAMQILVRFYSSLRFDLLL
mmetsp:Transcript_16689/g.30293  ORF Transcript_16689/g.30293 Transcript_16689/m.30293 type:complete len:80 (+) Transcript_16689:930-1169(+)